MMTVTVAVFRAACLTVSEKTETMLLRTTDHVPRISPLAIEAAGQRYRQATFFFYLGVRYGGCRRGGSTAAMVTLDTVVDESMKKMTDRMTRSPSRLCSRDGKLCYYGRLEHAFLAFVPCSILLSLSSLSRYVSLIRAPSSVQ